MDFLEWFFQVWPDFLLWRGVSREGQCQAPHLLWNQSQRHVLTKIVVQEKSTVLSVASVSDMFWPKSLSQRMALCLFKDMFSYVFTKMFVAGKTTVPSVKSVSNTFLWFQSQQHVLTHLMSRSPAQFTFWICYVISPIYKLCRTQNKYLPITFFRKVYSSLIIFFSMLWNIDSRRCHTILTITHISSLVSPANFIRWQLSSCSAPSSGALSPPSCRWTSHGRVYN